MKSSEKSILDPSNQVHSRDAFSPSHDAANWATLYPELIYEILTYCLSGVILSADAPQSFPWYLGHICQSWRSVFISSPCFWDHFTFNEFSGGTCLKRALTLVTLCIERTKDHPFSFQFNDFTELWSRHRTPGKSQMLEILLAHADRWRTACLFAKNADDLLGMALTKAKCRFGQLHSLQIRTLGFLDHSDIFQDAPNLTRVSATDYYQLCWSSITVLHINVDQKRSTYRFFADLDKMTCLEELVVIGPAFHLNVADTSPVELPSLKILSVDRSLRALCINAPALESLHLTGPALHGTPTVENLPRGVGHLKSLSFDVYDDDRDIARITDCTPELDHLILSCRAASLLVALQVFLRCLTSRSVAHSLRRITIDAWTLRRSRSMMYGLLTVFKSWEKRQFQKLCFVSVHVNIGGRRGDITSAVADLMRVGADKGFEIDVNFTPFPTALPFESW